MMESNQTRQACEKFFFERIAYSQASADDYREFVGMLWQENGPLLFRAARGWLCREEDARDVCQDAFLCAVASLQNNAAKVPEKVNFRAWLLVILHNLLRDRLGKAKSPWHQVSAFPENILSAELPPGQQAVTAEDIAALNKCIESLPERIREIVLLREVDGLSHKAIAERLHASRDSVCVDLYGARKTLRECVMMARATAKGKGT